MNSSSKEIASSEAESSAVATSLPVVASTPATQPTAASNHGHVETNTQSNTQKTNGNTMNNNNAVNNGQGGTQTQTPAPQRRFVIRKMPNIPAKGENLGRFVDATYAEEMKGEKVCKIITLEIELPGNDANGKPFVLTKEYNLSGRGDNTLREEIGGWRGEPLTPEEMGDFDADALLIGKEVKVEVNHRTIGRKTDAYITRILPATVTADAN